MLALAWSHTCNIGWPLGLIVFLKTQWLLLYLFIWWYGFSPISIFELLFLDKGEFWRAFDGGSGWFEELASSTEFWGAFVGGSG